jgi:hypothetical protein
MKYEPIPEMSVEEVEVAIERNQPDELLFAVLSAALYAVDQEWAQSVCCRLAVHEHYNVRGNAILGFGHIARIHGWLDRAVVLPIIETGLMDSHEYVRNQAHSTADDIQRILGWPVQRAN